MKAQRSPGRSRTYLTESIEPSGCFRGKPESEALPAYGSRCVYHDSETEGDEPRFETAESVSRLLGEKDRKHGEENGFNNFRPAGPCVLPEMGDDGLHRVKPMVDRFAIRKESTVSR